MATRIYVVSAGALEAGVRLRILKPPAEVYRAIVDPERMARYFISSASGPMEEGKAVVWRFADVRAELTVMVEALCPDRRIVFRWSVTGPETLVEIAVAPAEVESALVTIRESGWPCSADGAAKLAEQTRDWTHMLCCLKADLEHGVNLRRGGIVGAAERSGRIGAPERIRTSDL